MLSPFCGFVNTAEIILAWAGILPMAITYISYVKDMEVTGGLTNTVARTLLLLQTVRQRLAGTEVDEVGIIPKPESVSLLLGCGC